MEFKNKLKEYIACLMGQTFLTKKQIINKLEPLFAYYDLYLNNKIIHEVTELYCIVEVNRIFNCNSYLVSEEYTRLLESILKLYEDQQKIKNRYLLLDFGPLNMMIKSYDSFFSGICVKNSFELPINSINNILVLSDQILCTTLNSSVLRIYDHKLKLQYLFQNCARHIIIVKVFVFKNIRYICIGTEGGNILIIDLLKMRGYNDDYIFFKEHTDDIRDILFYEDKIISHDGIHLIVWDLNKTIFCKLSSSEISSVNIIANKLVITYYHGSITINDLYIGEMNKEYVKADLYNDLLVKYSGQVINPITQKHIVQLKDYSSLNFKTGNERYLIFTSVKEIRIYDLQTGDYTRINYMISHTETLYMFNDYLICMLIDGIDTRVLVGDKEIFTFPDQITALTIFENSIITGSHDGILKIWK